MSTPVPKFLYTESIFMDSGAYSLYNLQVKKRVGKKGQELAAPSLQGRQADYSFYDLSKGTEFRAYCDSYAAFCKCMEGKEVLLVNVDAIHNPEKTWEIQQFFENEHGIQPVPVVHSLTPLKHLDRYLDAGKYDLIGIGGFGQGVSISDYTYWADGVFDRICPASNKRMPLVRTHGFAMTSWKVLCRYPWWSVDSATWVKLSAYGWLYVPRWSERTGWRYDRPPIQVNTSAKSASTKRKRNKHLDNCDLHLRDLIRKWLAYCQVEEGSVDYDGEEVDYGARSHFTARSRCNLIYFKDLEESRPKWPYPLDERVIRPHSVAYRKGWDL